MSFKVFAPEGSPFHNPGNPHIPYAPSDAASVEAKKQAFDKLYQHMFEISDDPSGSDPADYLSPEEVATCNAIVAEANAKGWPNATDLSMRVPRRYLPGWRVRLDMTQRVWKRPTIDHIGRLRAWNKPMNVAHRGLTKVLFYPKVEEHKGYVFGHLSMTPDQQVALCEDGKLRSLRGGELVTSKGLGWGRLPDIELLEPALAAGHTQGVHYTTLGHYTLEQILRARMGGN